MCEEVFPLIIHNVLQSSHNDHHFGLVISRHVRRFFRVVSMESHSSSPMLTPSQCTKGNGVPPDAIKIMLNMVLYLRTMDKPE